MKSHDVQDEIAEGFEPGPLPPVGPDGALQLSKLRVIQPAPPRLCEAGPCANYHRFEIQLDAQAPRASRDRKGQFVDHEVFHTEVHHYCYPTIGVESILGSLPVLECNRWSPVSDHASGESAHQRAYFLESDEGKRYLAELEQWKAARRAEMAAGSTDAEAVSEFAIVVRFVGMVIAADESQVRVIAPITATLEWLRVEAIITAGVDSDPNEWDVRDANGAAFSDLARTIDQAGLVPESRVVLTFKPQPKPEGAQ